MGRGQWLKTVGGWEQSRVVVGCLGDPEFGFDTPVDNVDRGREVLVDAS